MNLLATATAADPWTLATITVTIIIIVVIIVSISLIIMSSVSIVCIIILIIIISIIIDNTMRACARARACLSGVESAHPATDSLA